MALSVQTNTAASTALKHLNTNSMNMNKALERLSSGFRINSAADDATGFAVSSKLDAQSGRLKAASQNATQAIALVKMADSGVNEIQNMVNRIQTLATQAASANNTGELPKLDAERIKLESQINKIANSTNYNGVNLLNGKDAATAATATAASAATATTASTNIVTTASTTGINENAAFTIIDDGTKITSVKSAADILDSTGNVIAAAGTELLGANVALTAGANATVNLTGGGTLEFTVKSNSLGTGGTATMTTTGAVAGASPAYTAAQDFQVGADNNANNRVSVDLTKSYTTTGLNLGSGTGAAAGGNLLSQGAAQTYIDTAKSALDTLITQRADLGATQNQLGFANANLATAIEQTSSAVSSIRDADMAAEMATFTKNQILTQASTAMLAQANQASQNVMSLFR